jgi:putative endonuclease
MTGYVYMTASQKRGTIYIGVTNSLARRIPEHRGNAGSREVHSEIRSKAPCPVRGAFRCPRRHPAGKVAEARWLGQWKIDLIEKDNPDWNELFVGITAALRV